jgi:hypothetical protein
MANEAAKKRVIKNREVIGKYRLILLGTNVRATPAHWRSPLHHRRWIPPAQALYVLYRVVYLWDTFSLWHMGGFALLLTVYAVVWFMLTKAAAPVCVRRPAPPSTAAQQSCTRFGAHRDCRAARATVAAKHSKACRACVRQVRASQGRRCSHQWRQRPRPGAALAVTLTVARTYYARRA